MWATWSCAVKVSNREITVMHWQNTTLWVYERILRSCSVASRTHTRHKIFVCRRQIFAHSCSSSSASYFMYYVFNFCATESQKRPSTHIRIICLNEIQCLILYKNILTILLTVYINNNFAKCSLKYCKCSSHKISIWNFV